MGTYFYFHDDLKMEFQLLVHGSLHLESLDTNGHCVTQQWYHQGLSLGSCSVRLKYFVTFVLANIMCVSRMYGQQKKVT